MTPAGPACFHCSEPIPAGVVLRARIAGRDEPVCCHGCRAVAEFIAGAGLGDYYRYRDAAAARADETPRPDRWSAYDRPELVERLTTAEPGGATVDHGAARGPALLGLQLARGQGAAPAAGTARGERQSRDGPRTAHVGSRGRPTRRPAARARARGPASAPARRRCGRATRDHRATNGAEAACRRRLRHDAGDDVRGAALHRAVVGHGSGHPRAAAAGEHAGLRAGRALRGLAVLRRARGRRCARAASAWTCR